MFYHPAGRRDWMRAASLCLVAVATWFCLHQAWRAESWQVPAPGPGGESYAGDELELLARVKAAQEHGWDFAVNNTVSRLGAPWTADWSTYAMPDMPFTLVTAQLANVIGLIPAANAMLLAAHVLAVLAFYFCSRVLGHRPAFAAAAALLFGFSYYNFSRSLVHFSFTLSFIIPLILLTVFLVAGSRVLWQRRVWWVICAGITCWTALANPYYGYLFLQLLAFAVAYRCLGRAGEKAGAWRGLLLFGVFFGSLALSDWSSLLAFGRDPGSLLQRNYASTEIFGLRFIDLFIPPPTHRWRAAAALGDGYGSVSIFKGSGELFSAYLGLVGIAGLAVVTGASLRQMLQRRFGLRPAYLPLICWIFLYSATGGINGIFALTATPLFRGTNRYSIAILALVLLAFASWATRISRRSPRSTVVGIALLAVGVGIWDQCPPRHLDKKAHVRTKIESDRQLGVALESSLPAGSEVFQLPAVPFLEQPVIHQMVDYELCRPYLFTHTMRFSYGVLRGKLNRWEQNISRLPASEMRSALESAGFAALYLQRKAFPDGGESLCRQLEATGLVPLFAAGDHVVYRLQPAAHAAAPTPDDPRMFASWDDQDIVRNDQPAVLFDRGWFQLEQSQAHAWRWACARATMVLYNPSPRTITVDLNCTLTALGNTQLVLMIAGKEKWRGRVSPRDSTPPLSLQLELQPGVTRLVWTSSEPARSPSVGDPRKLGFRIEDLRANFQ